MFIFDILVRCSDVWDKTKFSDFENIKIKDINKKRIGSAHLKAVIKAVQKLDFLLFSQKYSFMLNVLSKHGDLRNLNWTFQKLVKVCENYTFKMNDGLIVFKEALNFKNHNALRARTDFFVRHTFCLIQNSFGEKCFYGMIAYLVNNIFSDFINENNLNDYDETSVRKIVKDLRK